MIRSISVIVLSKTQHTAPDLMLSQCIRSTIEIHGARIGSAFTKFGFEFAAVSGTGAAQVQAGASTGLPAGVTTHTVTAIQVVEHSSVRTGTAGSYDIQFTWTAPTPAVG